MYKLCFVIPNYNHGGPLGRVLKQIDELNFKIYVIDDGSKIEESKLISESCAKFKNVTLIRLEVNSGKGGAVISGLKRAFQDGYTHAFQLDADGQHDLNTIPSLIELSKINDEKIVSGHPIYDQSVPFGRWLGRFITHFWVWIETLSFDIKDSMCGFRIYPLNPLLKSVNLDKVGTRMDFDIEILVRAYWAKIKVIFHPVKVTYPVDGHSNFQVLKDNWRISKMHTKLFFTKFLFLTNRK